VAIVPAAECTYPSTYPELFSGIKDYRSLGGPGWWLRAVVSGSGSGWWLRAVWDHPLGGQG